jgi:hypothetical protein
VATGEPVLEGGCRTIVHSPKTGSHPTATYNVFGFSPGSASIAETVWQFDSSGHVVASAFFFLSVDVISPPNPLSWQGPFPVVSHQGPTSATFEVIEETNYFTFARDAHARGGVGGSLTLTETWAAPIPAALPLFAAGLGIVTFLARRKKTASVRPA